MADDLLTGGGEAPLQPGTPRPANTITDERLMEIVNAVYTPTVWSDTLVQGTPDIPGKMNALEQYIATLTEVNRDMALAVIALRDSVLQHNAALVGNRLAFQWRDTHSPYSGQVGVLITVDGSAVAFVPRI